MVQLNNTFLREFSPIGAGLCLAKSVKWVGTLGRTVQAAVDGRDLMAPTFTLAMLESHRLCEGPLQVEGDEGHLLLEMRRRMVHWDGR